MSYRIQVTTTKPVTTWKRREWTKGGPDERDEESGYGYTPQIQEIKNISTDILDITMDTLDMTELLLAILHNGETP